MGLGLLGVVGIVGRDEEEGWFACGRHCRRRAGGGEADAGDVVVVERELGMVDDVEGRTR